MKRALQFTLAILSLIPTWYGLGNLIRGPAAVMDPGLVNAALDSQFRFQSAWYFALAMMLWWIIPNVDRHTTLLRIAVAAIFLGGLGRLYSYYTVGAPPPAMIAGMLLELGAPVLIFWQHLIRSD